MRRLFFIISLFILFIPFLEFEPHNCSSVSFPYLFPESGQIADDGREMYVPASAALEVEGSAGDRVYFHQIPVLRLLSVIILQNFSPFSSTG